MKIFLIVLAIILGSVLLIGMVAMLFFNVGMGDVKKQVINDVDLSKVPDGIHKGTYHRGRWTYDVEVTVKDHRIESIKNTNKRMNDMFAKFNSEAEAAIVKKQSPKVDVVSGATINTNAYAKAVEDALTKAQ